MNPVRPWPNRPLGSRDLLTGSVLALGGVGMSVASVLASKGKQTLGQQLPSLRLGVGGLMLVGLTVALLIQMAKASTTNRAAWLLDRWAVDTDRASPSDRGGGASGAENPTDADVGRPTEGVRLRLGASVDRLVALGAVVLAASLLAFTWVAVSGTPFATRQVSRLLAFGLPAVSSLLLGAGLWLLAAIRDQWAALDRIEECCASATGRRIRRAPHECLPDRQRH